MTIHIKDTASGQEQVMDDRTTVEDIIHALDWVKRERARQAVKYQRFVKPRMEAKRARAPSEPLPTDPAPAAQRPRGRPRKNSHLPADPNVPAASSAQ